jgi:hypothetical protein
MTRCRLTRSLWTLLGAALALAAVAAPATAAPKGDVRADPAPAVWIETMAREGGKRGIRVGEDFYPNPTSGGWAQAVVLDRRTLKPVGVGNRAFGCDAKFDQPTPEACAKPLREAIKAGGGDGRALAIVTNQPEPGGEAPYGLEWALEPFGVHGGGVVQGRQAGDFSAIVTSGGDADWHMSPPRDPVDVSGSMRGWLIRSNEGNYVFSSGERVEFDTQAKGSSAATNVVQIGARKFTESPQGSRPGGFQVVVADPQTLAGDSRWFGTDKDLAAMADFLAKANERRPAPLVVVSSIGDPRSSFYAKGAKPDSTYNNAVARVADQVERLGGSRGAIFRALDPSFSDRSVSYTLIARGDSGAGGGIESEAATGTAINARPLAGTLARVGANWTYRVADAPDFGPGADGGRGSDPSTGASQLTDISLQPPSRWPEAGNPKRTAAIRFVGEQVLGTADIRAQYWTVPFVQGQFDYGRWSEIAKEIGALAVAAGPGFEAADLEWAKDELRREIGWLEAEHRYLAALATPFSKTQLQSWAQLQKISDSVRDKVGVGGDEIANANANAIFEGVVSTLSALPTKHIGEAIHAVDSIYKTSMELVEINGHKEATEGFQSRADEVGVKMADRFVAAQEMLERQLPNVIAADYEKLRAAGSCSSSRPTDWKLCPFDHADWQFTQEDQAAAAEGLLPAMEIWAYGELLPLKYTAWVLPPWWRSLTDRQFYGQGIFDVYPFDGAPVAAQSPEPVYRNIPTYSHKTRWNNRSTSWENNGDSWQIRVLAYLSGEGTINNAYITHFPESSLLEHLWKPPAEGGLGIEKETFFDRHFKPRPFAHYPYRDGKSPAWCFNESRRASCP